MGLNISPGDVRFSYSGYVNFRIRLCEASGLGDRFKRVADYRNDEEVEWPDNDPIMVGFLMHSDIDGLFDWKDCKDIADRIEKCLPELKKTDEEYGFTGQMEQFAQHAKAIEMISAFREAFETKRDIIYGG